MNYRLLRTQVAILCMHCPVGIYDISGSAEMFLEIKHVDGCNIFCRVHDICLSLKYVHFHFFCKRFQCKNRYFSNRNAVAIDQTRRRFFLLKI